MVQGLEGVRERDEVGGRWRERERERALKS